MTTVLLIIHLFVTLALIGVVLIQRSEGGGLGVGTSQGMGSFMSGRGTANLLTRATAILATAFFVLSLGLALLNRGTTVGNGRSILDVPAPRPAAIVPPATPEIAPSITPPVTPPAPAETAAPAPTPAPADATPPAPTNPAPPSPDSPAPDPTKP